MKMEDCGFSACDVDRRRSYPHSSVAPHIPLFDALDRGSHSKGRREQREFLPLRYGEASYTATTPADLAPIPETYGFIAADRARRRPRRIGHLTRAEFPGSTGELRPHRWSAHPSPVGDYPTSPLRRVIQNSNQDVTGIWRPTVEHQAMKRLTEKSCDNGGCNEICKESFNIGGHCGSPHLCFCSL